MFRPERSLPAALALASLLAVGCGRSNLIRGHSSTSTAHPPTQAKALTPPNPAAPAVVAIPLKLTPARAEAFAQAVNLKAVDVPGSHRSLRMPTVEDRQEEREQCGQGEAQAIGGGRSERLDRGRELEAESISSSVIVMADAGEAESDLAYAESAAGLRCYSRLLGHKLARESNANVAIGRVQVRRLKLAAGASGIRITAGISGVKSGLQISLYVDAVALRYGPAEVELYATSFVQPMAARTEQQLLDVMRARARLSPL